MARPTVAKLERAIAELRELREGDRRQFDYLNAQLSDTKQRLKEIAAENESLRADKKWLQSMLSNTIQTLPEMFRSRNALPR